MTLANPRLMSSPPAAGPQRILLAEDDGEMRELIAVALRRSGYQVIEARNGLEMLDVLASALLHPFRCQPVDLIISDYHMPGVTGLSVLAGLRDSEWKTPFIVITAFGGPEILDQALRQGASAFFDKPFEMAELRQKVVELTEGGELGESPNHAGKGDVP